MKPLNIAKIFRQLCLSTQGSMAVWGAVMAPVLIGGAALSVDVSRMYNLDHDLQSAADALARAGAAELDQRGDSIDRAARAVQTLVNNEQKFGSGGSGQVAVDSVRYLKTIPDNDYDPVTADMVTTNPSEAQYVEVNVAPVKIDVLFPSSIVNAFSSSTLSAKSVAGHSQGVCGVAPIFVCNPYENSNTSLYSAMDTRSFQRRLVKLKSHSGGNSQYGPGNYGFLDPFDGQGGANAIRDAIAIDVPPVCFSKDKGVKTKPGNMSSISQGFNTRFDIYKGSFKKKRTDARYAPAANVVKGYSGKACKESPNNNAMSLPRDDCFTSGTCSMMNGRMGNGSWDIVEYVKINHNLASQLTISGTTYSFDYANHTVAPSDIPTRYEMYRWEIDSNSIPGKLTYGTANTPEEGIPQCHASGASTAPVDRRIIYAAVLNCDAIEANGGFKGRSGPHPVETFVKVFVTEPMGQGNQSDIWGEIVGPVIEGQDSVSRDQVALTR